MISVDVYANWEVFTEPALVGTLRSDFHRRKEVFSFEYAAGWLAQAACMKIDPDLHLYTGPQYTDTGRNFRAFLDSCPDRWGRVLMRRREAILAKREERRPRQLAEIDCLLGVYDSYRMGGLRFALSGEQNTEFISHDSELAAPPMARLRELEHAAGEVERSPEGEAEKWLAMLLAPGSSLGGARPKANVIDEDGQLWIAKFPSKNDTRDVGAWEFVVHQLADAAGLSVPEARIIELGSNFRTYLSRRFDRTGAIRHHFSSAMTELRYHDNEADDASYLNIAEFLQRHAGRTRQDLAELFRRIVFNIAVSNCDDHLRNHGFLLSVDGWVLSPAYDINAAPDGTSLSLNISDLDSRLDFDLARETAAFYQLGANDAQAIIDEVTTAVAEWENVARSHGLPRREITAMRPAFNSVT